MDSIERLRQFEYEQQKYIDAYNVSTEYQSILNEPTLKATYPTSIKLGFKYQENKQYFANAIQKRKKDSDFYKKNLMAAHLSLKKAALEDESINLLSSDAKVLMAGERIVSVSLDNGVGLTLDNKCQLVEYRRYGEVVTPDCFANREMRVRSSAYNEICLTKFQFVNEAKKKNPLQRVFKSN